MIVRIRLVAVVLSSLRYVVVSQRCSSEARRIYLSRSSIAGPKFLSEGKTTILSLCLSQLKAACWDGSRHEGLSFCFLYNDFTDRMKKERRARNSLGISPRGGYHSERRNSLAAGRGSAPAKNMRVQQSLSKRLRLTCECLLDIRGVGQKDRPNPSRDFRPRRSWRDGKQRSWKTLTGTG